MDDATKYLVSQGILGVVCLGLSIACAHLYRALREEMAARVADAKAFTEQAISLQGRAIDGMHRLADITEAVTKGKATP